MHTHVIFKKTLAANSNRFRITCWRPRISDNVTTELIMHVEMTSSMRLQIFAERIDADDLIRIVGTLLVGLCVYAAIRIISAFLSKNVTQSITAYKSLGPTKKDQQQRPPQPTTSTTKPKTVCKCPFSNGSTFVVETAEHLDPSPLDQFDDWQQHLRIRWLAAGISGQDQPGYLRAQLKQFRHHQHFLLEDHLLDQELALKQQVLQKNSDTFVMEPDSLEAQQEVLELFMAYLPQRYPEKYTYDKQSNTITVHVTPRPMTFCLTDWKDRPLELCERIVQEDLVLMRETPTSFDMAAAAVVFSFNDLPQKLGTTTNVIHAPVPGFEKHLSKVLYLSFKNLQVEKPLWRNNWTIVPTGRLDEPSDFATHQQELQALSQMKDIRERFLKVEYQTIRRLPRTRYLLFTVRTFVDPMSALERLPTSSKAAETLAASIRGMSFPTLKYKGIESEQARQATLDYLDSIRNNKGNGNIKPPAAPETTSLIPKIDTL